MKREKMKKTLKKAIITGLATIALASTPLTEAKAQYHEDRPRFQITQSYNMQGKQQKTSQYSVGVLISTDQKKRGLNNGGTAYASIEAMIPNKNHKIIGYNTIEGEQLSNPSVFRKYFASIGFFYETNKINRNKDMELSLIAGGQQIIGKQYTKGLPQNISKELDGWTAQTKIHAGLMFRFSDWTIGGTIGPILSSSFPKTTHPHRVEGLEGFAQGSFSGFQSTLIIKPNYEAIGDFFGDINVAKRTPKVKEHSMPMF